jgi:colanic acid/amylovoran biosynthesis protein
LNTSQATALKNILITGNHTCGNRGDAAILRGLLEELGRQRPDLTLDILSRFPESSSFFLQRTVEPDRLSLFRQRKVQGVIAKIVKLLINKYLTFALLKRLEQPDRVKFFPIPSTVLSEIENLSKYDAVIQVGGSFFVDVYGEAQFDYALVTLLAKKPLYILGHSVGPFRSPFSKKLAATVFNRASAFVLREPESRKQLEKDGIQIDRISMSTDTAWLIEPGNDKNRLKEEKIIAVTFRALAPFDQLLGISQTDYEIAFARYIDALNELGYQIRAFSTCTGIDGYPKDDRMTALSIRRRCKYPEKIEVIMDELNDIQLGEKLGECQLTVGTRLHSAIISMNFGTPAFALNYEHKSAGIMDNLCLPELARPVSSLLDGSLLEATMHALDNIESLNTRVHTAVQKEKVLARETVRQVLEEI